MKQIVPARLMTLEMQKNKRAEQLYQQMPEILATTIAVHMAQQFVNRAAQVFTALFEPVSRDHPDPMAVAKARHEFLYGTHCKNSWYPTRHDLPHYFYEADSPHRFFERRLWIGLTESDHQWPTSHSLIYTAGNRLLTATRRHYPITTGAILINPQVEENLKGYFNRSMCMHYDGRTFPEIWPDLGDTLGAGEFDPESQDFMRPYTCDRTDQELENQGYPI